MKTLEGKIMKLLTRVLVGGLALAFVLSLCAGPADAASKKKKKETKKEEKKEAKREARREAASSGAHPIEGGNLSGQPGYFYAPTAKTLEKGQLMGSGHLSLDVLGGNSIFQVPVGVTYGITNKIQINVNTSFYAVGGASGLYNINFGGKYGFGQVAKGLDIAAGLDFAIGPLTNYGYGTGSFGVDPYGAATYTFKDGLQLNGKLGLYFTSYSYPTIIPTTTPPFFTTGTVSQSYTFFQLDLGVAYPFDKNLTGIGELATNGVIGGINGGTPVIVGIRTGHDVQLQAFAGLDLNYTVGLLIGGGVVLVSK